MATAAREIPGKGDESKNVTTPPLDDEVTQKKISDTFRKIGVIKDKRIECNESITALRQGLVTRGFSLEAQAAIKVYLKLTEAQRRYFDVQVKIMRQAIGEPMQTEMDLVRGE